MNLSARRVVVACVFLLLVLLAWGMSACHTGDETAGDAGLEASVDSSVNDASLNDASESDGSQHGDLDASDGSTDSGGSAPPDSGPVVDTWLLRLNTQADVTEGATVLLPDGDILVLVHIGHMVILDFSPEGTLRWQKEIRISAERYQVQGLQALQDGGFVIFGNIRHETWDETDFFLLSLDSTGDVRWSRFFCALGTDRVSRVVQAPDSSLIVAATTQSQGQFLCPEPPCDKAWVMKFDTLGRIEWQKVLGSHNSESISGLSMISGDRILLAGATTAFDSEESMCDCSNMWMVMMDQDGEIQWQQALDLGEWEGAGATLETLDGRIRILGDKICYEDIEGTLVDLQAFIMEIEPSGALLDIYGFWNAGYDHYVLRDLLPNENVGFFITGYYGHSPYAFDEDEMFAVKLNRNMEVIWIKTYFKTFWLEIPNSDLFGVLGASDHGAVLLGRHMPQQDAHWTPFLAKVNQVGSLGPLCPGDYDFVPISFFSHPVQINETDAGTFDSDAAPVSLDASVVDGSIALETVCL